MSAGTWELGWALLEPAEGHEQAGRRPVLVFCNDVIAAPIGLVTALPLTAWGKERRVSPTEVLLPPGRGDLPAASLVMAHQARTIAARRLSPAVGAPSGASPRRQVAQALALWLDLLRDARGPRPPGPAIPVRSCDGDYS